MSCCLSSGCVGNRFPWKLAPACSFHTRSLHSCDGSFVKCGADGGHRGVVCLHSLLRCKLPVVVLGSAPNKYCIFFPSFSLSPHPTPASHPSVPPSNTVSLAVLLVLSNS